MRITKRQLRRVIREALDDQRIEVVDDFSPTGELSGTHDRPWGTSARMRPNHYSDVIVMSPNGDSVLVDGLETYIDDVPQQLELRSGFPMDASFAEELLAKLDKQMQRRYVEISVTAENGQWSM